MERRAFLPKLALLIGAAAVACREAVTAPFTSGALSPRQLIIGPDRSWLIVKGGKLTGERGGVNDPLPSDFKHVGPIAALKLPDCDAYCAKGAASCNPDCWHCGYNYSNSGCISLCTC